MKVIKFVLFGWEIRIQPEDFVRCHITDFPEREYKEPEQYRLEYTMDDRIYAMVGEHQFIDYIFRDFDMALFTYREYAAQLLEDVMNSLRKIRKTLSEKGASNEQLRVYDQKIHTCFERTMKVIKDRNDTELYEMIIGYEIEKYHNGDNWK